jgi:hypothetical protein
MQKLLTAIMGGLCVVVWTAPVSAATVTVTGQVVDLLCYNVETKANAGMDHPMGRECAWACAKWWGQPVGLLTADGKLYQLEGGLVAGNNAKIAPHVTHTVTITGEVSEKNGITMLAANDLIMVKAPGK